LPQIDTIRDTLKVVEIDGLKLILQHTVKKAVGNKVFEIGSNNKSCLECLKIIKGDKTHSFHSGAVISIKNKVDAIVRAKSNYNKSLHQVKKKVNKLEPVEVWNDEKGFKKLRCSSRHLQWITYCNRYA